MIFFPGCSLSSLFNQFWSKCLVGEFLQLKKFDGPKQCQLVCLTFKNFNALLEIILDVIEITLL